MAVIEVVDSDSEQEESPQEHVPDCASNSASTSPLTRLLGDTKGKQSRCAIDVFCDRVEEKGLDDFVSDLLSAGRELLREKPADAVNLNQLERLTALVSCLQESEEKLPLPLDAATTLLDEIYATLAIPSDFLTPDYEITQEAIQKVSYWRAGSTALLQLLQSLLHLRPVLKITYQSIESLSTAVIALSKFTPSRERDVSSSHIDSSWTTPLSSSLSGNVLSLLLGPSCPFSRTAIAQYILLSYLKPLFLTAPHPSVHPESGRKLARPRGGELFSDSFNEGAWKGRSSAYDANSNKQLAGVGSWIVFAYILYMIGKQDVEEIWHLLIPPLMTMLDDHEVRYRSEGITCLIAFLDKVEGRLLKKTGVSELVQKSLTTTYSFTSTSENVPMIRSTVRANLLLVKLLYPVSLTKSTASICPAPVSSSSYNNKRDKTIQNPSLARFESLCSIYQSVVLNIFAYSSSSIPFQTMAYEMIDTLVLLLGTGSIRFLSDTLPTLVTCLGGMNASRSLSTIFSKETAGLYLAALKALGALIRECQGTGRIEKWRGLILGAVATLWSNLLETEQGNRLGRELRDELQTEMRKVVVALQEDGGLEAKKDIERIIALDSQLFAEFSGFAK